MKASFVKIYGMKTTLYLTAHIKFYRVFYIFLSIRIKFITEDDNKKIYRMKGSFVKIDAVKTIVYVWSLINSH